MVFVVPIYVSIVVVGLLIFAGVKIVDLLFPCGKSDHKKY